MKGQAHHGLTGCKAVLYPGSHKSLEKTYQQGRGFFPHPNTCTSMTKKAKRFLVWEAEMGR